MHTRVSSKDEVVIPRAVRKKLRLLAGDRLETRIEGNRIVLIPTRKRSGRPRVLRDSITGLPVLTAGPSAPRLTSKQVEILAHFP